MRVGALRGRWSRWCSRLSPVTQASRNGQPITMPNSRNGAIWPGIITFQEIVWPQIGRLPVGHDPQQALGDAHVPVGLGAGRHLRRVVGSVLPDRVDRQQAAHQGGDAEDHEEEAAGLGHVDREHRVADDVLLGAARPRPLGVLVEDQQQHVRADQRQQQAGDQQHVDDVEPRDDHVARELAAEQEERHVGADHRGRLHQAVRDPQPGAGEQVVGQGVAGEALEDAEQDQQRADHPVQLAGLAERAGEEDAHHVHEHRGDEEHRGPVVHLPHQQAAAHVEGDVERRGVGVRHRYAAQLGVGALVRRLRHARARTRRSGRPRSAAGPRSSTGRSRRA